MWRNTGRNEIRSGNAPFFVVYAALGEFARQETQHNRYEVERKGAI